MYNSTTLLADFIRLIGFRQQADATGWQISDADLLQSDSGRFYDFIHPSVTIENLISVAPRFDQIEVNAAARNTAFSLWLRRHVEQAILKTVDAWLNEKIGVGTAGNLLSDQRLFDKAGSISHFSFRNTTDFFGMEIVPYTSKNIAGRSKRIGLHLTNAQTVDVELYSSDSLGRLQMTQVNHTGNGLEWFDLPATWTLEGGKQYYIGYHRSKVAGEAINGAQQFDYGARGMLMFPTERYYKATAFHVTTADNATLWDIADNSYTVSDNYGINLELDFTCDYTNFLISQRLKFVDLLCYGVAIYLMKLLITNPPAKINQLESKVQKNAPWMQNEIVGHKDEKRDATLKGDYDKAMKALQFDRGLIDDTCLPCNDQQPRFNVIGSSSHNRRFY